VSKLEEFTSKALFFNQLAQRKYQLRIADLNIKDIIQFSILEIADSINEKNIQIKYDAVQSGIFMQADKDLMFKAFLYTLDNAVKFTTPNSSVDLCLSTSENSISFSCTDHGPGFPDEILSQLLMPFRLMNDLNHQKSVLSLFTIKQITNLHNGEFRIFNKENAGGCVELIFPKK
jgi:K+-sensing histidine kinase KdpD